MTFNKRGESVVIDGVKYAVGMNVIGRDCEYEGFRGYVTEIRGGEDKDTKMKRWIFIAILSRRMSLKK